jgi:hypothetical protein
VAIDSIQDPVHGNWSTRLISRVGHIDLARSPGVEGKTKDEFELRWSSESLLALDGAISLEASSMLIFFYPSISRHVRAM